MGLETSENGIEGLTEQDGGSSRDPSGGKVYPGLVGHVGGWMGVWIEGVVVCGDGR